MIVGTIPEIIQIPMSEPIISKIRHGAKLDVILLTIPSSIFSYLIFKTEIPMIADTAAATRSANWLGPPVELSPKSKTLIIIKMIKEIKGIIDVNNPGFFIFFPVKKKCLVFQNEGKPSNSYLF